MIFQGDEDIDFITFFVFELWDYVPTLLWILVVTGRGVLSNSASPSRVDHRPVRWSVGGVLASARLVLVKSGLWCCGVNEDENGYMELHRLEVESPLWEGENARGERKEPYFYSADSMTYVRPVALHNFPIYGDHDFAEELSPDRIENRRAGSGAASGSHLGGLAKRCVVMRNAVTCDKLTLN